MEQPIFNPFEMALKNVMENIKTQKEEENSEEKEVQFKNKLTSGGHPPRRYSIGAW